jgi:diguanylate cyclase (GGDEF)-like protein
MQRTDDQERAVTAALSGPDLLASIPESSATSTGLIAYAIALVVAAVAAIAFTLVAYDILPTIAITDANQASGLAIAVGIGFWVLFGFVGSVRPRGLEGGAVVTFHMPFVVAGTILGGPLVGALMGVVSLTELRELRRVPLYGVLANHAICVLAAVVGGIAGSAASWLLDDVLPVTDPAHTLVVGIVVAAAFLAMDLLLVLPVVALRNAAEFAAVIRRAGRSLRATLVAELTLGWLMAATYLAIAWWAPMLSVLVILAVWDAHDRREELRRDPMTGLLNDAGVEPLLEEALDESRRHGRRHALLFIDLDRFGQLNKVHGEDVGDDVLRAVALRLAAAVRSTDVVGRQNRAGDEFVILLRDLPDDETTVRLAWRVHGSILKPVRVRGESLDVTVGASIGIATLAPGTSLTLVQLKRIADHRMQAVKRRGGGVSVATPTERASGESMSPDPEAA